MSLKCPSAYFASGALVTLGLSSSGDGTFSDRRVSSSGDMSSPPEGVNKLLPLYSLAAYGRGTVAAPFLWRQLPFLAPLLCQFFASKCARVNFQMELMPFYARPQVIFLTFSRVFLDFLEDLYSLWISRQVFSGRAAAATLFEVRKKYAFLVFPWGINILFASVIPPFLFLRR